MSIILHSVHPEEPGVMMSSKLHRDCPFEFYELRVSAYTEIVPVSFMS